jgi:outer membrane protein
MLLRRRILQMAGLGALLAAAMPLPAAAASDPPPRLDGWTVTLGAEGRVLPSFEGSDRFILLPVPLIDIRRAGTPRRFRSTRDGLSVAILESGMFRFGATGKLRLPRYQRDDPDLRGLGNVGWGVEVGLFGEFWPVPWLRTRGEVRQGLGAHNGIVSDLSADVVMPVTPQLTLSAGPRLAFASTAATMPYFGVTPAQSIASGLPMFNAQGGIHAYGAGGLARYEWSQQWATHFFVEYDRLAGDAANSPLVRLRGSPVQLQVGLGFTYSFDVGGL